MKHGPLEEDHRGVIRGCGWGGGGRIVAASEMLRPSVEACSASRSDAPGCKK